jgi:hypothetical protein
VSRLDSEHPALFGVVLKSCISDHSFHSQTAYNDMTAALRTQLLWCTTGIDFDLLEYVNVFRPFVHAYNTYRMNRYLVRELDEPTMAIAVT